MLIDTWQDKLFLWFNRLFLLLLLFIVLYPLIYITSASISDPIVVNQGKMWMFPKAITFEGYVRVFQDSQIWNGYRNTVFYTVVGTLISLLLTIPASYALARRDLSGRSFMMGLIVATMFFNGGLIPTYLIIKDLGMLDTVWAILIPGAVSAWNLIVTRTYFQMSIPRELEEAAFMDGCSNTRLFASVVLPLSMPIIAVMALFYGIGQWNAYFNSLIYLSSQKLYPLQLILRDILVLNQLSAQMLMGGGDTDSLAMQAKLAESIKYSTIIVSSLPVIMIYPFLQRYFIKGVMLGSIKG